ncbi:MAG: gliding motility protein GldM [Bacteroidetes bacterium]|nr:gliding motility protein GldM [Bacteroidota bacterium]
MSGAANCPETPRQKMIGMMYLMLTAELALNVGRVVLDAFSLVDDSLTTSTEIFAKKNEKLYNQFEQADTENHVKVGEWRQKALKVKVKADSLYHYIQDCKVKILIKSEGKDSDALNGRELDVEKINNKDDMNVPSQVMVGSSGIADGRILKNFIVSYRQYIDSLILPKDSIVLRSINQNLNTEDPIVREKGREGERTTWERHHFENLPLVAVITILSKLQSDIRNTEADVVSYLYSQIDASSFKFNKLSATVIPTSDYVIQGGNYQAEIFLAAFDTTRKPVIFVGDYDSTKVGYKMKGVYDSIPIVNGKGVYKVKANKEGYQKWGGLIQYSVPGGGVQNYPFKSEFKVAKPNLVVSPTSMNVFYYKIDNPVEISVPGMPSDKILPSAVNATIKRSRKGGYVVRPTKTGGIVKIRVTADINGQKKLMGVKEFRIKLLPRPVAKVAGKSQGTIKKNLLLGAPGVNAELEDFVFDLRFKVKSFTVTATVAGYSKSVQQRGSKFSSNQRRFIKNLKSGSNLIIEDIKAAGPDARLRELSPLVFKIK